MKPLLAVFLWAVVTTVAAADTLVLRLEVYRFAGAADLIKTLSPAAQLELLADKPLEISQTIETLPHGSVRSVTMVGALTLGIEASVAPANGGRFATDLKIKLDEQVLPIGGASPATTSEVVATRLALRPDERRLCGASSERLDDGLNRWTMMVIGLKKVP